MRSNAGLVKLVRCGDVTGHTQLELPVHDQRNGVACAKRRPGVPQERAAKGFLCRKVGDGCALWGYGSR